MSTLRELVELLQLVESGQFVPTDPRATFFARGQQAIQYSGSAKVPHIPAPSEATQDFTNILKVNTSQGAPRVWQVKASQAQDKTTGVYATGIGVRLRVRWSVGSFSDSADIDLISGSACFCITADALEVLAQNALVAPDYEPGDAIISVAVAPYSAATDYRKPTRTVSIQLGINQQKVLIPRHAQRVSVLGNVAEPFDYYFADSSNAPLANQTFSTPLALDLPGGADAIWVSPATIGVPFVAFVFQLGL